MPTPITPVASPSTVSAFLPTTTNGRAFMLAALKDIEARVQKGERVVVVFDIDNTLFDSRARTAAAANVYGEQHGIQALIDLLPEDVGLNGTETAKKAGITNAAVIKDFSKFWSAFFFDGAHYDFDTPIASTIAWAKAAKKAGAEVVYLTGREQKAESDTRAQLEAAGLPDTDAKHVISKPATAGATPAFKASEFQKLTKTAHVAWFLTESQRDIAAVQQAVPRVPCVVLDYPLGDGTTVTANPGTPHIAV